VVIARQVTSGGRGRRNNLHMNRFSDSDSLRILITFEWQVLHPCGCSVRWVYSSPWKSHFCLMFEATLTVPQRSSLQTDTDDLHSPSAEVGWIGRAQCGWGQGGILCRADFSGFDWRGVGGCSSLTELSAQKRCSWLRGGRRDHVNEVSNDSISGGY
jgi:hypothetical protein